MHTIPWTESPLFSAQLGFMNTLTARDWFRATHYNADGYLIIDDLFQGEDFGPLIADMRRPRQQDLWTESAPVLKLATDERVLDVLRFLYGREPVPFQTLNFAKGSEQMVHSDTMHFNSLPAKWMCGVWVALEDITIDQGPLIFYPKSHKLPEYTFNSLGVDDLDDPYAAYEEMMTQYMVANEPSPFTCKKGACLIWASNLWHGGMKMNNPDATRYSQVTHYFFEDVIPVTPRLSNELSGEYYVREYVPNIKTGIPMLISYNGRRVFLCPVPSGEVQLVRIYVDNNIRAKTYMERYSDVAESWNSAFDHYVNYGHSEGRIW